jgi:hypothetical protein
MELASDDNDWVTPASRQAEMLRAYGKRNELVPGLLQPRVVDGDGDGSFLSLLPSLFAVARPTLRMAPTIVLDSSGSPCDAKRRCR